jgi:hypothetical protein
LKYDSPAMIGPPSPRIAVSGLLAKSRKRQGFSLLGDKSSGLEDRIQKGHSR